MPKGVYKRTEETKRKISDARKGKPSGMLGKKHSEITKEKIKMSMKGRSCPWLKGKLSNNKGKHWKIKDTGKMRKAKIGNTQGFKKGSENLNWKGGRAKDTTFYKIRRRLADGYHTLTEWENLKAQYNWTCPCCKKREPEIKLAKDHIIPISKGGSDNIENIQPLCKVCNSGKYNKTIKFSL